MIRRESSEGVGYTVADLNDVRHLYAAVVPRAGATFEAQALDALQTLQAIGEQEGMWSSIVKQAVFVRDAGQIDECRRIMKDCYGEDLPATTYVRQPPCQGKLLSIEACGVGRAEGEVRIERLRERLVVAEHHGVAWIHCGHVFPKTSAQGVYDRSLDAFGRMKRLLGEAGVPFDHVVRTWFYLGDIVGAEGSTQRYQELNRARSDFYRDVHFGNNHVAASSDARVVYPASTGIGAAGRDVLMSCVALASRRADVRLVPLENPRQVSAFDYSACYSPRSPKFARAMAVAVGNVVTILVSGTASITDSESRHGGDVCRQTEQTLENIAALISRENLSRHGLAGCGATLDDLTQLRVYLKRPEDYEAARAVCRTRLGEVPVVYAVADICRPELLVEIEGVAFAAR